jgi:hypothetical protein
MSQGGGKVEVCQRQISVGVDGTAFPGNCFLIIPELQLDDASNQRRRLSKGQFGP